jgi:hypothetical protein
MRETGGECGAGHSPRRSVTLPLRQNRCRILGATFAGPVGYDPGESPYRPLRTPARGAPVWDGSPSWPGAPPSAGARNDRPVAAGSHRGRGRGLDSVRPGPDLPNAVPLRLSSALPPR